MVNLAGEIIGINEIWMGLGGAIPSNLAKNVADQIVANKKVTRAWLGLSVQPRLKHEKDGKGILVSSVIGGSPAETSGIRAGDFVVRVNGVPVDAQFIEQVPDFNRIVAALPIGQEAEVVILRDNAEIPLKVTPVERESVRPKQHELKPWGITASNISLITAKEMKRKSQDGVLVTSIRPGGPVGDTKPAIGPKDVIVEVEGKPVKNLRELTDLTEAITKGQSEPVPVLTTFERKTERFITVVKVGLKEPPDPGVEVKKAWLPVETQVLTRDIAALMGDPGMTGFRITSVYAGSTAEKAGLKIGDLLLALDGEKLTASAPENYEELSARIRQYRVGDTANLSVMRGKEQLTVPVELVRSPKLNREMKEYRDDNFDLSVRETSFFDKAREEWKADQEGVLVSEVKPGGWAALGELNVGDLILAVNGVKVSDLPGFEAAMKDIAGKKPDWVVFQVLRGIYTFYVELEPKWNDQQQ